MDPGVSRLSQIGYKLQDSAYLFLPSIQSTDLGSHSQFYTSWESELSPQAYWENSLLSHFHRLLGVLNCC